MVDSRFLPSFCQVSTTFALVLLAELLALLLTLVAVDTAEQFWSELGLTSLFILWITLTSAMVLCLTDRWWQRLPIAGVCGVFMVTLVGMSLSAVSLSGELMPENGADGLGFIYARTALIAGLCGGLWLHYRFIVYQRRMQVRAESVARQEALQARMRPHFLFNSLNAIASLLRQDPGRAEDLLLDLADLFRAILKQEQRLTSLREEVALARQYLNVEQQRLGPRLEVEWAIDPDAEAGLLPPLSLQPLLENAVYHGIEPSSEPGLVAISARVSRNRLVISITNPLPECRASQQPMRTGNQLAVENLRLRLEGCFPGEAKLQTSLVDERYQTRLVIPFTRHPA